MPLRRGKKNRARNFREFGAGSTYRKTRKRYGKRRADKQRVAVILGNERRHKRR